jgi:hypothetical protein
MELFVGHVQHAAILRIKRAGVVLRNRH